MERIVEIDLHGYHPVQIEYENLLSLLIEQVWQTGAQKVVLIHGHGKFRAGPRPFANTNTGYLGLTVRRDLRHSHTLRQWIKHTTISCGREGSTSVKLKRNSSPSRKEVDLSLLPARRFADD